MTFYGYILVVFFNFFKYIKGDRGGFYAAGMLVGVSQIVCFITLLALMEKLAGIDWLSRMFTSSLSVAVMIGWIVGIALYYKLDKLDDLQKAFEEKTDAQRFIWGIIAILSLAAPFAALAFLSPVAK